MDNDFIKVLPRIDINERGCDTKEGYVEARGSEVPKTSIRKSSRLQIKKTLSSYSQDIYRSYHSSSKYALKSSKASPQRENFISESKIQKENKHQFPIRNENNGVSEDTAAMKSSTAVPSFKYHVQSKDGIQIVVDLNLKRSDWLKTLEKTVCVCQNHPKPEFESFRKEVESLGDKNKTNNLKISSPDKTNASVASMNSYVQNNFPLKSTSREIGKTLPSAVEKEVVTVSGSKRRWSKVDQNSKLELENCENTKMQKNCSPNTDCRENVAVSCEDIKFSELSSQQKDSSCSRTIKASSEKLLTNTTEFNQEAGGNHKRSTVENGERINFAKGMELSGREENALVTSASDDGPKRKKLDYNSNHINGQSHERILRSTKMLGAQILERGGLFIRRSSRLFPKRRSNTPWYIYK